MENKTFGSILLAIGIALLLAVFYFMYSLYYILAHPTAATGGSIASLFAAIPTYGSYIIAIMALFFGASIGYKISTIGINLMTVHDDKNVKHSKAK